MCDTRYTPPTKPRPQWGRLYTITSLAIATLVLVELWVPVRMLQVVLGSVVAGGSVGAIVWWLRANRVTLDLLEWCACASTTVTVRVIASQPGYGSRVTIRPAAVGVEGQWGMADELSEALVNTAGSPSLDSPSMRAKLTV